MHIQIINFNLNGLSHEDYSGACNEIAQTFADLPGLISKHWLANEDTNTYGGVYFWESKEAMQTYLESEVFSQVANNPSFANAASKDFAILKAQRRRPAGPLEKQKAHGRLTVRCKNPLTEAQSSSLILILRQRTS